MTHESKKLNSCNCLSINCLKVHQPNMPAPEFERKSPPKSKYADSVVENDTRIGRIVDKIQTALFFMRGHIA